MWEVFERSENCLPPIRSGSDGGVSVGKIQFRWVVADRSPCYPGALPQYQWRGSRDAHKAFHNVMLSMMGCVPRWR